MILSVSILVGAVLGTRFKVLCLVPTTLAGAALVTLAAADWHILTDLILMSIGLQIGYAAGLAIRFTIAAARVARMRTNAAELRLAAVRKA
jgi:hypothetical protein